MVWLLLVSSRKSDPPTESTFERGRMKIKCIWWLYALWCFPWKAKAIFYDPLTISLQSHFSYYVNILCHIMCTNLQEGNLAWTTRKKVVQLCFLIGFRYGCPANLHNFSHSSSVDLVSFHLNIKVRWRYWTVKSITIKVLILWVIPQLLKSVMLSALNTQGATTVLLISNICLMLLEDRKHGLCLFVMSETMTEIRIRKKENVLPVRKISVLHAIRYSHRKLAWTVPSNSCQSDTFPQLCLLVQK